MKITIDRSASLSVQDQISEQIRYHVASGHLTVGEVLPSTRVLGKQVGVSFHTVRKAYQQLEAEGILDSKVGSGFRVRQRSPLGKSERLERGAAVVLEMLQRLIGLGLRPDEIEHLLHEQMDLLEGREVPKIVVTASTRELAQLLADQLADTLPAELTVVPSELLPNHPDAEYVITPFSGFRETRPVLPSADLLGVSTTLTPHAMEHVVRLLDHETLILVTRDRASAPVLVADVQAATGFGGPVMATTIDEDSERLRRILVQGELLLYTPPCRRRLASLIPERLAHAPLQPIISPASVEMLRERLPV